MKRCLTWLMIIALMMTSFSAALGEAETAVETPASITKEAVIQGPVTLIEKELALVNFTQGDTIQCWFMEDEPDIPFITLDEATALLNAMFADGPAEASWELDTWNQFVIITRSNGATVGFNFGTNTVTWQDYDRFFARPGADTRLEIASSTEEIFGDRWILKRGQTSYRNGQPVSVCLNDYQIPMFYQDEHGYIPLQTVSDLFFQFFSKPMAYNGEAVFYYDFDTEEAITDEEYIQYFKVARRMRSESLAEFTFNEMCLSLDLTYGLKSSHNIGSFEDYLWETGLATDLMDPDVSVSNQAFSKLLVTYLADMHSAIYLSSPYADYHSYLSFDPFTEENVPPMYYRLVTTSEKFANARAKYDPDGTPAYEEVGDTAYVTLNSFTYTQLIDYRSMTADEIMAALDNDTIVLIHYANEQILREGSPIKKVVVDLSCNGGGILDAAYFLVSWLSGSVKVNAVDPISGAECNTLYTADVNWDGVCDENDTLANRDLELYCLISPVSFSCGNTVPSLLKNESDVVLVGQATSGGSCVVQYSSLADGTVYQISSAMRLSRYLNGSYYDIDEGIEPDVHLGKLESFFNREKLNQILDASN